MGRRLVAGGLVAIIVVLAIVVLRTLSLTTPQPPGLAKAPARDVDVDAAAAHLARGLTFETIALGEDTPVPAEAFFALHEHLAASYPRVHASLERELVSDYSLLYRWPGRDASRKPGLLMAHQDVVPVDAGEWQHPPFAGEIVDGVLWGRGAIDDKGSLYAILEAVELLLAEGFVPESDLYIFFGHDEELGGPDGAVPAAALLAERGVELAWVLDEGGFVVSGLVPGSEAGIALVGIAEKGSVTYTLSVDVPGGHSSMPPRHTAIGILAEAINRLEANPVPGGIDAVNEEFLVAIAPQLPFPVRAALANLWLFRPLVEASLSASPPMDAMQRTTTAVTVVHGGVKSNVLPSHAEATVNFRIKPGDTAETVREHVVRSIDDERIVITRGDWYREASPVSRTDSAAFALLRDTIGEIFPGIPVVPYTVVGGTDSRNFYPLTPNVFRFAPFRYGTDATTIVHGTDERLEVAQLGDAVRFYARLIESSGRGSGSGVGSVAD